MQSLNRFFSIMPLRRFFTWLTCWIHPSWMVYASIFGFLAGISFCYSTQQFWQASVLWLVAAGLAIILSVIISRRWLIFLAFFAGILLASFRVAPELISMVHFSNLAGNEITITGVISEDPDTSEGKTVLRLTNLQLRDTATVHAGVLYVQLSGQQTDFMRSDQITLQGKLNQGFGTFVGVMYRPTVLAIDRAVPGDIFAEIKQNFATATRQFIPSPEIDLGLGYLMGLKNGLSEDFSNTLRLVGMTHVVVASGAHLGIIVSLTKKLFGRLSKFAELLFALLMIAFFVLIVGFTPSMTRAALVTSLTLLAGYIGRRFTPIRLLSLVAAITLCLEPSYVFNLGWQLSFASFFGLLVLLPVFQRQLYGGKSPPWLASMLLTSLATSLMCAPILIYSYGVLSLLSFVANLIILPTLPYIMLLVFLTGISSFFPPLATLFAKAAVLLLDLHIFVINYLSEKTMFIFNLPTGVPQVFFLYIVIGVYLVLSHYAPHLYKKYGIIKTRCKLILRQK